MHEFESSVGEGIKRLSYFVYVADHYINYQSHHANALHAALYTGAPILEELRSFEMTAAYYSPAEHV
jgi:hypothetical protein